MSNWEHSFSYCDPDGAELEIILCHDEAICISVCSGPESAAYVSFSRDNAATLAKNILAAVAKNSD